MKIILKLILFIPFFSFAQEWSQIGFDIDGVFEGDASGSSISINNDASIVAIGSPYSDGNGNNSGHVRIFEWNGTSWLQRGMSIEGEADGDNSGQAVSMSDDGNSICIGAPNNGGNSGHARVFDWDGTNWVQRGQDIDGENQGDLFGTFVSNSANGNTVAIGAPNNIGGGTLSGHVRVFDWDGINWTMRGQDIDGESSNDVSGIVSLTADANTIAIGAPNNDGVTGGNSLLFQ